MSDDGRSLIILFKDAYRQRQMKVAHNRQYTLSQSICKRLRLRGMTLSCVGCGKPIEVGENVISKKDHSSVPSKLYHSKCYEDVFN